MIIWGSRGRVTTIGSGTFHCPRCSSTQPYKHQKLQRYFTLYFIPLFPLDDLGEHIECGQCHNLWKTEVLRQPTGESQDEAIQNELRRAMKRSMALVILANGKAAPGEIAAGSEVFRKIVGMSLPDAELAREVKDVHEQDVDVARYLSNFGGHLSNEQKESLVMAACGVALYDGPMQPAEREAVEKIATALGLTQAHLRGILAGLESTAASA